jgi:hypothetical protein
MRTAGPTARPSLSFFEFCARPFDVVAPSLGLLHRLDPANPFIAGERRYVFPFGERRFVGNEDVSKVRRKLVNDAGADAHLGHTTATPIHAKFYVASACFRAPAECPLVALVCLPLK